MNDTTMTKKTALDTYRNSFKRKGLKVICEVQDNVQLLHVWHEALFSNKIVTSTLKFDMNGNEIWEYNSHTLK